MGHLLLEYKSQNVSILLQQYVFDCIVVTKQLLKTLTYDAL